MYIISYLKCIKKWERSTWKNREVHAVLAKMQSVFQQQTGGVCFEGNLLFTPEVSSLRPRGHAQFVSPITWRLQYGFFYFSCMPSSLFTVLQVTGDVDEHITHSLLKKKTTKYNVMFWWTTAGAEFWFCDSPPPFLHQWRAHSALVFHIPVSYFALTV